MYSYKNIFIIMMFILSSFCFSCSQYLFPELKVKGVSYDDKKIIITFSDEIEKDSVQKSISLVEDDSSVTGYFQCTGNKVLFYPVNGIRNNYDYDLMISTSCEDKNGISLANEYHKSFSTRKEHDRPQIISITPNNQLSINGNLEFIDIVFSEAIVQESFIKALSISPNFDFFLDFKNNDTNVRIIPKNQLALNTDYVITINTELEDLSRNFLLEDKKFMFYYNKTNNLPAYTVSVYNENDSFLAELELNKNIHDIPTNCSIQFNFSHAMDLSAVSAYFYFTPTVDYKIIKDEIDGKYVRFDISNAKWNTKYDLVFLHGLPDIYGQRFEEINLYTFTTDSELNNPPCFVEGIIQTSEWNNADLYETTNFSYLSEEKIIQIFLFQTTTLRVIQGKHKHIYYFIHRQCRME